MNKDERCENCRFFVKCEDQHTYGDCHRLPPQFNFSAYFTEDGYYTPKRYKAEISRHRDGVWPNLSQDAWCGEFKERSNDDG
ncbi:hypothetical protein [Rhizorhapis sp.]|uniref:hypothetical protein n=1 Tax=Rhizorhapis sp. TaxID=1968842 RepID=UPI002B46BD5E|nr:hypothetical protein [Rhizorhapis sp.]HKR17674.1 hypothetical protein [Rhizorhapis sp.]